MSQDREAKLKALRLTMEKLDKTYGKGAVMRMRLSRASASAT